MINMKQGILLQCWIYLVLLKKINSDESERVMNIISYMFESAEKKWPYVKRAPIELHQIKCVTFSDNIAMALELPENETLEETKKKIQSFITYISVFQGAGLAYDYLFRGGITIGELYIDSCKNFIWGKALVETHMLEEKTAIYPRVVLGHQLDNFDISEMERICKDFDGMYCIDYWSKVKEKTPEWIENNKKMIKEICDKYKGKENVWQKYGWLKYHIECDDESVV
ncbi:MAG: hypothetical protein IKW28_10605 [Lachnospiraceae bacterium]|nr:hypothetical protein [Lachnospiraceae bacterium]